MDESAAAKTTQIIDEEWVVFPGGELEGRRPKVLCATCRSRRDDSPTGRPLCFECYRASVDYECRLLAAANLDTASSERFGDATPYEPVNRPRLLMLQADRRQSRTLHARSNTM